MKEKVKFNIAEGLRQKVEAQFDHKFDELRFAKFYFFRNVRFLTRHSQIINYKYKP